MTKRYHHEAINIGRDGTKLGRKAKPRRKAREIILGNRLEIAYSA